MKNLDLWDWISPQKALFLPACSLKLALCGSFYEYESIFESNSNLLVGKKPDRLFSMKTTKGK
ncbi:hypothetical protein ACG2F4_04415 [Halalkalibaculum sp. DA3122]